MISCKLVARGLYRCGPVNKGSKNFAKHSQACCIFISSKVSPVTVSGYGPVMHNVFAITHNNKNVLDNWCFFIGICTLIGIRSSLMW